MGSKHLLELITKIELLPEHAWVISSGSCGLPLCELGIDPYEFLIRAEEDYQLGGNAAILNAITNAKRAIVGQIDQVLISFGYPIRKWKILKKIETLQKLGVITPRILKKVSLARNLLEHEYLRPTESQIEDALDLATLFIGATKPISYAYFDSFSVGNKKEQIDDYNFSRQLNFQLKTNDRCKSFFIRAIVDRKSEKEHILFPNGKLVGETIVSLEDDIFPVLIRLALAAFRGFGVDKAISSFFEVMKTSKH